MDAITIEFNDAAVLGRLRALAAAASEARMRTVFREIGEDLAESTKRRFETSTGPDGRAWAPLKTGTVLAALSRLSGAFSRRTGKLSAKGAKALARRKPLVDTGTLLDTIHYQLVSNGVEIGTNRFFGEWAGGAAVHQFGSLNGHIPARPFLGLSATDTATVLEILQRHLLEATMK